MASQENERFTEEQHSIKRLIQKEGSKLSQCFSQNENVAFFTTKYKQKALNFVVKCNFFMFFDRPMSLFLHKKLRKSSFSNSFKTAFPSRLYHCIYNRHNFFLYIVPWLVTFECQPMFLQSPSGWQLKKCKTNVHLTFISHINKTNRAP